MNIILTMWEMGWYSGLGVEPESSNPHTAMNLGADLNCPSEGEIWLVNSSIKIRELVTGQG